MTLPRFNKSRAKFCDIKFACGQLNATGVDLENEAFSDIQSVVGRRILRYLIRHPEARDTTDGIMDWWLTAGRVGEARAVQAKQEVEKTLEAMVSKGWLIATKSDASPRLYSINEERVDEIEAFLVQLPETPDEADV